MRAARFHDGAEELSLEEIPVPEVGPGDVLVDVQRASFCGSDYNYLKGKVEPGTTPITLGHEGAGIVAETGDAVSAVEEGDRVAVHYIDSCGHCEPCLGVNDNRCRNRQSIGHHVDGTFAEYIRIPERCAMQIPESVSFGEASVAGCAVSTAFHAVDVSGLEAGDTAAVFGVGGVGLQAVLWARYRGAECVVAVDLSDEQLAVAEDFGADVTLNPKRDAVLDRIEEVTDGWGVDVALECSGAAPAMEQAIDAIGSKHGYETGTVLSVGIQSEPIELEYGDVREGALKMPGDHTREDLSTVLSLAGAERIDVGESITHRLDASEIGEAMAIMDDEDAAVGRITIDFS